LSALLLSSGVSINLFFSFSILSVISSELRLFEDKDCSELRLMTFRLTKRCL
jgi:hypothetical protein